MPHAVTVQAGTIQWMGKSRLLRSQMRLPIPKILSCSQLPIEPTHPLEVSLRVVDEHNSSAGEK